MFRNAERSIDHYMFPILDMYCLLMDALTKTERLMALSSLFPVRVVELDIIPSEYKSKQIKVDNTYICL